MNLTPDVDKFIPYSTLEWMDIRHDRSESYVLSKDNLQSGRHRIR